MGSPSTMAVARASRLRGARALFTGAGANLALHVGDDEQSVRRRREQLEHELGAPVRFVNQVHSTTVHVLRAHQGDDPVGEAPGDVVTADAIVTDREDIALGIMVADCLPVLLADGQAGVVAAAHAGRRGLLDGVLAETVSEMVRLGARPERVQAVVGPAICAGCYEVPEQMRADAAQRLPATSARTSWGTPAIDLRAGARQALEREGIPVAAIDDAYPCTREDERFFSYRREQTTGRFVGVIQRGPAAVGV